MEILLTVLITLGVCAIAYSVLGVVRLNRKAEELDTLHRVIDIMDRQDAEVRMMAAHLPPYNRVIRRGQNRMENLVIEEDFVDLLREGTRDQIIAKLGGSDRKECVHLAASMLRLFG